MTYGTTLSVFDGTDPNGTWKLYVLDDTEGDAGAISSGGTLKNKAPVLPLLPLFAEVRGRFILRNLARSLVQELGRSP